MRLLSPVLLSFGLLAGCAGNVADYVGPRTGIVRPQLIRYGIDATQSQCVSNHLAANLTPLQMRRLVRIAAAVEQGFYEADRLTVRDLIHVAGTMSDAEIGPELGRALEQCGVVVDPAATAPPAEPAQPTGPRPPSWLNLGAAPTGQAIAVDAASLEQDGSMRTAWFRLTNPNQAEPTGVSYLLRIDCAGRTIEAMAHRVQDASGAVTEQREYERDAQGPLPVEGGTVMEIAWLALCT